MQHNQYLSFFETAATKHREIAHGSPGADGVKRESFFRINDDEEMQEGLMDNAAFPALSCLMYQGKLYRSGDLVKDNVFGGFKVTAPVDENLNFKDIEVTRARCKRICDELVALIIEESEKKCSFLRSVDINSFRYHFIGPENGSLYGCAFLFSFVTNADTVNATDLSAVFSL